MKVAVRRLPPTLSSAEFASVADDLGASRAVWRSFIRGTVEATGSVKRTTQVAKHGTAYLGFEKIEDAVSFYNEFNGFRFFDGGIEYFSSVERAINQNTPPIGRRSQGVLNRGCIEKDADYLSFLRALEEEADEGTGVGLKQAVERGGEQQVKSKMKVDVVTALMEDVRARRKNRFEKKKGKGTVRCRRPVERRVEREAKAGGGESRVGRRKKRRDLRNDIIRSEKMDRGGGGKLGNESIVIEGHNETDEGGGSDMWKGTPTRVGGRNRHGRGGRSKANDGTQKGGSAGKSGIGNMPVGTVRVLKKGGS